MALSMRWRVTASSKVGKRSVPRDSRGRNARTPGPRWWRGPGHGAVPGVSLGAGKSVFAHDLAQRGEVGWASGRSVQDGCHLAEVVGAKDARGHDCECRCVDVVRV